MTQSTKSFGQVLLELNPIGRLTVACHYPEDQTLIFHQQGGGRFRLSAQPGRKLGLAGIKVTPHLPGLDRFVSDGAIGGAGAAAVLDWDIMEGAIMGDWLEKQHRQDYRSSYRLDLVLTDLETGEHVPYQFSLSAEDCKRVYHYFR